MGLHGGTGHHLGHGGAGIQTGQLAQCRRGKQHGAHFVEVDAGDHRVLHIGCSGRDDFGAQGADADKGAGGQLEVLGDAAIEFQAQGGACGVDPLHRVASAEKTFFVKGVCRFLG